MEGIVWLKALVTFLAIAKSSFGIPQPDMDSYLNLGFEEVNSDEHGQQGGTKSTNCSCGWTNKARIVGGKETLKNEFPLVVGLKVKSYPGIFCGGTIITSSHVLTAAHCTYPLKGEEFSVVVGEHDQEKDESSTEVIAVEKVIDHENYVHKMFNNDISLLVLSKKINFNQKVGPACLPSGPMNLLNEHIKVLGWGALKSYGSGSNVLMKVNLRVIELVHCKNSFPKKEIPLDNPKQLCTHRMKKDSCQGDSGGPVIWLDPETNRYTLVGLVSYGKTLCATRAPAVNTDVSAYLDWIQKNVQDTKPGEHTCAKI